MISNYGYYKQTDHAFAISLKPGDPTQETFLATADSEEKADLICKALNIMATTTCLENLKEDEPFFVLRGQDYSSPEIVLEWIKQNINNISNAKLESALTIVKQMKSYGKTKVAS